jgi:hypothetical protein
VIKFIRTWPPASSSKLRSGFRGRSSAGSHPFTAPRPARAWRW